MIHFALKCAASHAFDSWFRTSDAFEALLAARHVTCPICGSAEVQKSLMSPNVRPARGKGVASPAADSGQTAPDAPTVGALSTPGSPMEEAFAEMRRQIETNSDYVGLNFAAEVRRMHDGTTPTRSIYGEAKPDEARQLIEDGIPVAPLPFMPARKIN
jgi:hypothetical protein